MMLNSGRPKLFLLMLLLYMIPAFLHGSEDTMNKLMEYWLDVEENLHRAASSKAAGNYNDEIKEKLLVSIREFRLIADTYTASPLYWQYEAAKLISPAAKENMEKYIDKCMAAVSSDMIEEAGIEAASIRAGLLEWRRMNSELQDALFNRFFYVFCLFVLIISILMISHFFLHNALHHSRTLQRDSAAFTRQIMAAQEKERYRISSELHDTALQDLGRLIQLVEKTEGGASGPVSSMVKEIAKEIRLLCTGIMPPNFSRFKFTDLLMELCINFEKRTGIECRASIADNLNLVNLGPDMELQCYRIIQEALSNVEKHAHAAEAVVSVRKNQKGNTKSIVFTVSDDGAGFSPPSKLDSLKSSGSLGLRGMYERASILGGELSIKSERDGGTMVRLELPLEL
ncbi:MAG: sensor histidine kinase [Treponema sp.]|jgi:signal transduction histidine kinase|nr:sensor histidine kinase [Treponema sp.]